ncbi:MAG: hypothetical protein WDN03_08200 [Rhizomicrobium sp.]
MPRADEQHFSHRREAQSSAGALEEIGIQDLFEPPNAFGESGLRAAKLFGSASQMAGLGDRLKVNQIPQLHP